MITINEPVVIAQSQEVSVISVQIIRRPEGGWTSIVRYEIADGNGSKIAEKTITYDNERYNDWWDAFNSGKFLLEEYVKESKITFNVPNVVEDEFRNKIVVTPIVVEETTIE